MVAREEVSCKAKWDGVCPMNEVRMAVGASAVAA